MVHMSMVDISMVHISMVHISILETNKQNLGGTTLLSLPDKKCSGKPTSLSGESCFKMHICQGNGPFPCLLPTGGTVHGLKKLESSTVKGDCTCLATFGLMFSN